LSCFKFYAIDEKFEKNFAITLDLYGISDGKVSKIMSHATTRLRHLVCSGGNLCEPFTIMHLGFIDFAKYFIVVKFSQLESIHERYHIENIHFHVCKE